MTAQTRTPSLSRWDAPPDPSGTKGEAVARRPSSLYVRVVAVNAAILILAVTVLALTPVTVSSPVATDEGLLLAAGLVLMVGANALLLRASFRGLSALARRMRTLDVLRPQQRLAEMGSAEARALIAG